MKNRLQASFQAESSKRKIKEWKESKKQILPQTGSLDLIQQQRPVTEDEQFQKAHLAMEYEEVSRNEEIA